MLAAVVHWLLSQTYSLWLRLAVRRVPLLFRRRLSFQVVVVEVGVQEEEQVQAVLVVQREVLGRLVEGEQEVVVVAALSSVPALVVYLPRLLFLFAACLPVCGAFL